MNEIQPPVHTDSRTEAGPEIPPNNVKIYDRPERKGPSPVVLCIALVVILLVCFLLYRMFLHPSAPPVKAQVGLVGFAWASSGFSPRGGTHFQRR